MPRPAYIPDDSEIAVVETKQALFSYKRGREESMILLPRPITGCFNDLGIWLLRQSPWHDQRIEGTDMYAAVRYRVCDLEKLSSEVGMDWPDEMGLICDDMRRMEREKGVSAELRVVRENGYDPETYKFHQDGQGYYDHIQRISDMGRIMCCYNDPVTECLLAADAVPVLLIPANQSLPHFEVMPGRKPFRPGVGDIWRQVSLGQGGRPLVHRAVQVEAGNPERPWEGPRPWNPPRLLAVC